MLSELVHYSAKPLVSVKSVEQPYDPDMKPNGLWVSVEDGYGWREWCKSEGFALDRLKERTRVVLADDARILNLATVSDIDAFTAEYMKEPEWGGSISMFVDWRAVADRYQGIVIAPYQWGRRLHHGCSWYYGWDCSSGCIWDADAVVSLTPAGRAALEE